MYTYLSNNPTYERAARQVPDDAIYVSSLNARLHSGDPARDLVRDVVGNPGRIHAGQVAVDIEAAGLGADSFRVRCITAAWEDTEAGEVVSVLLDPRRDDDRALARVLLETASWLIFHNSPYDVPPLYHLGVLSLDDVNKIIDTIVMARMAYPDKLVPKNLEKLAGRADLLGLDAGGETMDMAFKARGYANKAAGFADADIDLPVYRLGAMADTVVTLKLGPALYARTVEWLTSSPFQGPTVPDAERATYLIDREQQVNRVMLRRSARGLLVDTEYLASYTEETAKAREEAANLIRTEVGEEAVGRGDLVVAHLDTRGLLPDSWPRTPTGRLKADKAAFKELDHPLVAAHRTVADTDHVLDYLTKVDDMASLTGRVHPQVSILGASTTGRMSYSFPEAQQFPAEARPILVPDTPGEGRGWYSIDFKAIEPVVMANCAGDTEFLHGFNHEGADLYAPIVKYAEIDRKTAKVVLLALMYGQGIKLLSATLGVSEAEARDIQQRVFKAMPPTAKFMDNIRYTAEAYGCIMTADGRRLPIPTDPAGKVMAYKGVNYFCQGTAYAVLAESIVAMDNAGISDHIQLAVHDELVVSTEVLEETKSIMSTSPAWLDLFAGHPATIRVDDNPLPNHWDYV